MGSSLLLTLNHFWKEEINMNDTDMQIQWQEGSGESVEIGYLNPHGQQCCGHRGAPGTDHGTHEGRILNIKYSKPIFSRVEPQCGGFRIRWLIR